MNLASEEQNEAQEAFLPKTHEDVLLSENRRQDDFISAVKRHMRLVLEIFMAVLIFLLLVNTQGRKPITPSAVPLFPSKKYLFVENPRYLHENMFASKAETLHTLHNWIELSSYGRGYVKVNESEAFGLGEPYRVNSNAKLNEPVYMMSVFHQLHCLSYLVQTVQTASEMGLEQELAHHSAHCFDYLRQSIMCNADTSLEGKSDAGPGWGSIHECKDYDAVLSWANDHTVNRWRNGLLPNEAVL